MCFLGYLPVDLFSLTFAPCSSLTHLPLSQLHSLWHIVGDFPPPFVFSNCGSCSSLTRSIIHTHWHSLVGNFPFGSSLSLPISTSHLKVLTRPSHYTQGQLGIRHLYLMCAKGLATLVVTVIPCMLAVFSAFNICQGCIGDQNGSFC